MIKYEKILLTPNLLFLFLLYQNYAIMQAAEAQQPQVVNIHSQSLGSISLDIRGLNLAETEQTLANKIDEKNLPLVASIHLFQYKELQKRRDFTVLLSATAATEIADRLFSKTLFPDGKFRSIHQAVKSAKKLNRLYFIIRTVLQILPITQEDDAVNLLLSDPARFFQKFNRLENYSLSNNVSLGIGLFVLNTTTGFIFNKTIEFINNLIQGTKSSEKTQASKTAELVNKTRKTDLLQNKASNI